MEHQANPLTEDQANSSADALPTLSNSGWEVTEIETIGAGAFGKVKKVWARRRTASSEQPVLAAVKEMFPLGATQRDRVHFEIDIMRHCRHDNIMPILGAWQDRETGCISLLMDLMDDSLHGFIFNPTGQYDDSLFEGSLMYLLKSMAQGFRYLHQQQPKILHSDGKPANVLLKFKRDHTGNIIGLSEVRLSDLGGAKVFHSTRSGITDPVAFSLLYAAPELVRRSSEINNAGASDTKVDDKADVYSFGIILGECLTREKHRSERHSFLVAQPFSKAKLESKGFHLLSPVLIRLYRRCIDLNPDNRPTMQEVLQMLETGRFIEAPRGESNEGWMPRVMNVFATVGNATTPDFLRHFYKCTNCGKMVWVYKGFGEVQPCGHCIAASAMRVGRI